MNGVYETATGDLIRAGLGDLSAEDVFAADTETYRTDVPVPALVRGREDPYHRWNGAAWVTVAGDQYLAQVAAPGRVARLVARDITVAGSEYAIVRHATTADGATISIGDGGELYSL